jgi:hypothetical protein
MSPTKPAPKRARSSREPWRPPRDRAELMKSIGAAAAVVLLSVGAVLFLGRDHLGSDDTTPVTPANTTPLDTTPTTPTTPTAPTTPDTAPATGTSTPAGETLTPPSS